MKAAAGNIFIVTAPSGAGKTSLVNALLERVPSAALSISHTTRPPRDGEADGDHYHFVDEAAFRRMIDEDAFIEHARVFGHYYGTSRRGVDALRAADRDVILEIDWQGARQIKASLPESIAIFILPPSLATLEQRLKKRGKDAPEVIARRLGEAREEMAHHGEFDYLVFNDDFETALAELASILQANRLRQPIQARRHADIIANLLD